MQTGSIEIIRRYDGNKARFFPLVESIPLEDVVKKIWEPHVLAEGDKGRTRIDRRRYEIALSQSLRDKLA